MKAVCITAFLVLSLACAYGQKALTFEKAVEKNISIHTLDSLYKPALSQGADSLQAVFRLNPTGFQSHYVDLLKSLSIYLKSNGFTWGKKTKAFNRIYFNERGRIDYFLYHFREGEIDPDKAVQFEKLLNGFIKTYTFTLPVTTRFAQCSPVSYND